MKSLMKRALCLLFAAGFITATATAQEVVVQPLSTTLEPGGAAGAYLNFEPRWIDGSGFTNGLESIIESGDPIPAEWPRHISGYNATRTERIRDGAEFETLTFDLGGVYEITGMVLWNCTEETLSDRGFEHTVLSYSTDGGATFSPGETLTWTQRLAEESPNQGDNPVNPTTYAPEVQTLTTSSGPGVTHVRMVVDNFSAGGAQVITMASELRFTGIPAPEANYVAVTPTDWTDSAAWSDGNPAMAGTQYFAANSNVVLQTPATTATFPGEFLSVENGQRLELMVSGTDVITIDPLRLDGGAVAAGVVGSGEAKLAGQIIALGGVTLGNTNGVTRDLRILSEINSTVGVPVQLSASGQTIYIDNSNNTVAGIWSVNDGTTVEFADGGAVGLGSIVVSNSTLRINGDWDGLSSGEYLNVMDTPNALVDLGTYSWTVNALTVGSSNVLTGFTYDAADLNAIGSTPMFTGTGTIQVGDPYIPPPPPTTYYLQAPIPANKWIGDQDQWYDAPSGGSQMPYYAIFEGSTFDVNGFEFRSENTPSTREFDGLLVVNAPLVNSTGGQGYFVHYDKNIQFVAGVSQNAEMIIRPHRGGGITTGISTYTLGENGYLKFRTLSTNYGQTLEVGTLVGSGKIEFGLASSTADDNGIWALSVSDGSAFTGTLGLQRGQLTFQEATSLENAAFEIAAVNPNTVVLASDVWVLNITVGATTLATVGEYTAADLNAEFGTDRFSGAGILHVGLTPPPTVLTPPTIAEFSVGATDVMMSGTSSITNANAEYRMLFATDLVLSNWVPVVTNTFDANGEFSITYPLSGGTKAFYRLDVD